MWREGQRPSRSAGVFLGLVSSFYYSCAGKLVSSGKSQGDSKGKPWGTTTCLALAFKQRFPNGFVWQNTRFVHVPPEISV